MKFEKATRKRAKLRLGITGPSGSGKTWGALDIARGIGGRIAVIDTEKGSASIYSDRADFDVLELEAPYTPERFIEALDAAVAAGYDIVVLDSITHEWTGPGGCLELVDVVAATKTRGNTWAAWNEVTPRHRAFLDALVRSPVHVIATMRSKTETAQSEVNGKKSVVKLGMKAEQRDGAEYEFTTVLDIVHAGHFALASKDRTGLFAGDAQPITVDTGRRLAAWLNQGDAPVEHVKPELVSGALAFLNAAVKIGSEELKRVHIEWRAFPGFAAVWMEHGATLKAEAAQADAYHASLAEETAS